MTEHDAYIALNMVQGIGAVRTREAVARLGSAVAFAEAGPDALASVPGIGPASAKTLSGALAAVNWRAEEELAERYHARLVAFSDPEYPAILKQIHDPPLALYVLGDAAALSQPSAVAMVGTRSPTAYGREIAGKFAFQLAQIGVAVVSGLARGIDTESHVGALKGKGVTVAVLGGALDKLYPQENRELARQIVRERGAVISEYPFGRSADRQTFPMRNRVVSGLCKATLVVEGGPNSGTLITAAQALEQGRGVLAVPGRVDSPMSIGPHKLIKDGARLAQSIDDVLEEIGEIRFAPGAGGQAAAGDHGSGSLGLAALAATKDPAEREILMALREGKEMGLEEIIAGTGLPAGVVSARLIGLEMKRAVKRLPGNLIKLA